MPEHLRALAVVLTITLAVFAVFKNVICESGMLEKDYTRRATISIAITLCTFLSPSYWIFLVAVAIVLVFAVRREDNPAALFAFLLFAAPNIPREVPGMGIAAHLFLAYYVRILALIVLVPKFIEQIREIRSGGAIAPGQGKPDYLTYALVGYFGLILVLNLTTNTLTNSIRHSIFYAGLDAFVPCFVFAHSLRDASKKRDALLSFLLAYLVLASICIFEFVRTWSLYMPLSNSLGANWEAWGNTGYLSRDGLLRASGSTGHPLGMGFVSVFGIVSTVVLFRSAHSRWIPFLGLSIAIGGLLATLSRGPMLGAAIGLIVAVAFTSRGTREILKIGSLVLVVSAIGYTSPIWEKYSKFLPLIGNVDNETVEYRRRLLEIGIEVVSQNPLLGAYDFIYSPEMQELKQGQGIIDIVNQYLGVALSSGLVGLTLFVCIPISALFARVRQSGPRVETLQSNELTNAIAKSGLVAGLVTLAGGNLGHLSSPVFYCWVGMAFCTSAPLLTSYRKNANAR